MCFLGLDSCIVACESYLLFGCYALDLGYCLLIGSGVWTMIVIGTDIRMHNTTHMTPTTYIITRDNRVLIALACDNWTNEQLEEAWMLWKKGIFF